MIDYQAFSVVSTSRDVSPCVSTRSEFGRSRSPGTVVLEPLVHLGRQRAGAPRASQTAAVALERRRAATRGGGRARCDAPRSHKSIGGVP